MFSNLRNASKSDAGGYEGGGSRHSSSLRELGALLRERRETMGVSLAEVEVATRIRQKYLSALESDEWHLLPGEVVGRGFLRNYADYLGLQPDEAIERRRAVSDMALSSVLANTSAGSNLPPIREVDYRPKEVELKDEGDGIQRGEIRLTPIFAIVGVALLVVAAWWGISAFAGPMGEFFTDIPERVVSTFERPTATPTVELAAIVNPENLGMMAAAPAENESLPGNSTEESQGQVVAVDGVIAAPQADAAAPVVAPEVITGTGGPVQATSGDVTTQDAQAGAILIPTNTPEQTAAPAAAPIVEPDPPTPEIPTPEPQTAEAPAEPASVEAEPAPAAVELPTPTPEPVAAQAQAPVVAPACGDARSTLSAPGVNQVVSGVVGVTGTASHDNFQYYKLEYAPGLNAGGGFVYFAGSSVQVNGGLLGNLDTRALPNGEYTIRLTVVDQTSNYPPPCDVSIIVQN